MRNAIDNMVAHARPLNTKAWVDRVTTWKNAYPITMFKHEGVTAEKVIETINRLFKHSVVATDVGQNQLWATQYVELDENRKLLTSGGLGTMGYGLPAAIGAQLGAPDRKVVCITGDGGMQMNIQEIATAVLYRLPIIVCILNNGYLGNVRQWQEMFFEGRYSMTCLMRREGCPHACKGPGDCCPQQYVPDFVKLAESYQAYVAVLPMLMISSRYYAKPLRTRMLQRLLSLLLIERRMCSRWFRAAMRLMK